MCCSHLHRREFLGLATVAVAGVGLAHAAAPSTRPSDEAARFPDDWNPQRPMLVTGKALRVQPVLMYAVSQKREATSWKSWGGVQSEQAAAEEVERIAKELKAMADGAGFAMEMLPVRKVRSVEEAAAARGKEYDVAIIYAATGSGTVLKACMAGQPHVLLFVRHRSGPVYYWYEALSGKYLRTHEGQQKEGASPPPGEIGIEDVVVDDYQELLWRLRALYAVKNFLGSRIVALGGTIGKYASDAPALAKTRHGIEIIEVSYGDFEPRIRAALADRALMAKAEQWTNRYLSMPQTSLATDKQFVINAFALYAAFKALMAEHGTVAFTIKECMSTIMPMAKTTACLPLSLMNDEGLLAFCESDFVVIPAGILLHYISGQPVFLHNSTFPHNGLVTCAHCTGPRRMDGNRYEPAKVVTHYESDYGAAPKVEMPKGQLLTFIDPDYSTGRWVGFRGKVESNPFYEICRSQQDVEILGPWKKLVNEVRDSHWLMVYGDYLREAEYAARKVGMTWESIE